LQLFAEGTWKQSKVTNQEIDLRISGGIVSGNAVGLGKLVLHKDGKSIKKLTIRAKSAGGLISVDFVANPPPKKAPMSDKLQLVG
jgi:phenolic acid decarboxylase